MHRQVWWQFSLVGLLGGSNGWNVTTVGWQDLAWGVIGLSTGLQWFCFPAQKGTLWGFRGSLIVICRHIPILVSRIYKSLVVALVISFLLCLCTFVNGFRFEIPLGFESKSQCIYEVLWALKAKISTHDGIRKHLGIFQPAMLDWKANQRPQQRKPSKIHWLLRQAHPNGWSLGSESTITTCVPSRSSFGSWRLAIFSDPLTSQHVLTKKYTYTWWKF